VAYNDILRLRIYQTLQGGQVVNVLHFVNDDISGVQGALELANHFVTNLTTSLKARAFSGVAFQFVEVQKIVPFEGGPSIVNFPGGTVGGVGGSCVSGTLCEVVTIYSQRGGRRGRGRIYLPPSDTSGTNATGGSWQAVQTARTTTFANALASNYIGASHSSVFTLGVWSRASGPEFPPWSTSQFARATGLTVRTTIRTQRRRQLGVGR